MTTTNDWQQPQEIQVETMDNDHAAETTLAGACILCQNTSQLVQLGDGMAICVACRGMQQRHLDEVEDTFDRPYIAPDQVTRSILLGSMNSTVDEAEMRKLSVSSKLNAHWDFLMHLFEIGRSKADAWVEAHLDKVGKASSTDIASKYL